MVVVTGGSGFVGGNVVRALLSQGIAVRAVVRHDRRSLEGLPVELANSDLDDPESLLKAFQKVEAVFHFAGSISLRDDSWEEMERVNILGTRHVVKACLHAGVRRLIYCSSIHALEQEPLNLPVDEQRGWVSGPKALPYDRSKAAAEAEIQAGIAEGLDAVILNPTGIIGPYDFKPSLAGQSILSLVRGRIPILVRGGFDWVDVRDVALAAVQAWQKAPSGRRYLLSGHWCSVLEVARLVGVAADRPAPRIAVPLWLARLAVPVLTRLTQVNGKTPLYTIGSLQALHSNHHILHDRAACELGYAPRPLVETITDTVNWFQQNGYLKDSRRGSSHQ